MFEYWKTIFETNSPISGEIKVVQSGNARRLVIQGYTQSKSLNEQGLAEGYWDVFNQVQSSKFKVQNALILGLGAGTIAQIWGERYPDLKILGVEIDPTVVEVAKEYFDLPDDLKVIIGDACQIVTTKDSSLFSKKYDLIAVDVFSGGKFNVQCGSEEFVRNLAFLSSRPSCVIFNRIYNTEQKHKQEGFLRLLKKYFAEVSSVTVSGPASDFNLVIFAWK